MSSSISLRRVGDTTTGSLGYSAKYLGFQGEKYQDADGHGAVKIRYLPPGEYELFAPSFFVYRGRALSYRNLPQQSFRVRFVVSESEATYVGRFAAAAGDEMFFWLDREGVDLALARKQLPATARLQKVNRTEVVGVQNGLVIVGKRPIPNRAK